MTRKQNGILCLSIRIGMILILNYAVYPLPRETMDTLQRFRREYRFEEAIALLSSALVQSSLDSAALTEKARMYQAWHKYEQAASAWQIVLSFDSINVGFWKERWKCLWKMAEEGIHDTLQACSLIQK
ncbi:MAG: hypothetical protein FJY66_04790, partial [Calditrichaeota bacterium]|nr:hypothetical protein [Calditrichota bacterium]